MITRGCLQDSEVNLLSIAVADRWPDMIRQLFEPRGVNLVLAHDREEFLEIAQSGEIHTTLVDMDDRSGGIDAVRILRRIEPELPCIGISCNSGSDFLGKVLMLGVFSVVYKPVELETMRDQLHRLFSKRFESNIFA